MAHINQQTGIVGISSQILTKKATREPSRRLFDWSPCAWWLTGIVLPLFGPLMRSLDFYEFLAIFARLSRENRLFLHCRLLRTRDLLGFVIDQQGFGTIGDGVLVDDDFGNVLFVRQFEHDVQQSVLDNGA